MLLSSSSFSRPRRWANLEVLCQGANKNEGIPNGESIFPTTAAEFSRRRVLKVIQHVPGLRRSIERATQSERRRRSIDTTAMEGVHLFFGFGSPLTTAFISFEISAILSGPSFMGQLSARFCSAAFTG
jgi:hypothetical protein